MSLEGGEIEISACGSNVWPTSIRPHQRDIMGRTGQKGELPSKPDGKSKKKPPERTEDDDVEDGDIATPKRDRSGNDDEPL